MKPYPEPCSIGSISADNGADMPEREDGRADRDKPVRAEVVASLERSLVEHVDVWESLAGR